ncbi:MAG: hypothetical protein J5482_01285 [Oscillospiraceae bacterium]|nr:hypothetical protein [Oscillospiraceae bacterium]
MELEYTLIDPTKNITLLVTTPIQRALQPQVAGYLLRREKAAEQVAFLEQAQTAGCQARLQMMGGEFCGNAAMSLGAWLCWEQGSAVGENRTLLLEVSGAPEPVACTVTPVRTCYLGTVAMPLPERVTTVELPVAGGTAPFPAVFFPGICHVIVPANAMKKSEAEDRLRHWAARLLSGAAGLLLWNESASSMEPLVYVQETDTAVWEQGCGSGSAAIGAWLTVRRGENQCLSVRQPGGAIAVTTLFADGKLTSLTISGTVHLGRKKRTNVVF